MVSYGSRIFIPINKHIIVELLKTFNDGSKLLLKRLDKIDKSNDNIGAYGGSTMTASVTKLSSMAFMGHFQELEIANNYIPIIEKRFVLMKNGKKYTISRLKSLKKIYRSKWGEIEEYAAQNKPDFKNQQDLIELLEFCTK
ncbi:MAG: hypothetical protein PHE03_11550 [Bacteroidales bacterium]|nr:hypothetical protein [Bacteroidales bacterium]